MLFFGISDDQFIARYGMRNGGDAMSFMKKGSHCIVLDSRFAIVQYCNHSGPYFVIAFEAY
jgi:hypothetical protein